MIKQYPVTTTPDALVTAVMQAGNAVIHVEGGKLGFHVTVSLPEDAYVSGVDIEWGGVARLANRAVRQVVLDYMRDVIETGQRPHELVLDAARYFGVAETDNAAMTQLLELAMEVSGTPVNMAVVA